MLKLKNAVLSTPAFSPEEALAYFEARLSREADCWDVHQTEQLEERGFVLLDVRSEDAYLRGHLPGATHHPHWQITSKKLEAYPEDTLFVVYCAGPHCNGATRAAIALAKLGRPVKEMMGGITGWQDEGFELEIG